jgi:hypothetical protein
MQVSGVINIKGGCHCGALRYELDWPRAENALGPAQITARRCSCSFCTRIDGAWTSHPDARLSVNEDASRPASHYRFESGTADFIFCGHCGITPLVTCELDGDLLAVVNVNTLDDDEEGAYEVSFEGTNFDGESLEDRLARRKARWIGNVGWTQLPDAE